MWRALTYLMLAGLSLVLVGGLGDALSLTIMLPATTAILTTHVAFSTAQRLPFALVMALMFGYLDDLQQGAPLGLFMSGHAVAVLLLRWISARMVVRGMVSCALSSGLAVVVIDTIVWGMMFVFADAFGVRRETLLEQVVVARWHVLATVLAAPPLWAATDAIFTSLRLDPVAGTSSWRSR